MGATGVEQVPPEDTPSALAEALSAHEAAQAEFLVAVADFTSAPSDQNIEVVTAKGASVGANFLETVRTILTTDDMDTTEKARLSAQFFILANESRAKELTDISPTGIFRPVDIGPEDLASQIMPVLEEPGNPEESVTNQLLSEYVNLLNKDIKTIIDIANNSPAMRRRERLDALKGHATDLGKIAAGVAIGALAAGTLDRFLKKARN